VAAAGGELEHISWIRSRVVDRPDVALGIGDDAAAVRLPSSADCLLAVDMLMEGTHFTIPPATASQIGRKAMAVNLSDMAAMAGRPLFALVAVALNRQLGVDFAQGIFAGLQQLADEFDVVVVGGDTNIWDGRLVVSVTILGEATGCGSVTRGGAKVGDWIVTTGRFGGSLEGQHLNFRPRVDEALRLHRAVSLHAMIDVSDGLAADLFHILDESNVGAVLDADTIPISEPVRFANDGKSPLQHALADGEDFELLLTVDRDDGRQLIDDPPISVELTKIGEIVEPGTYEIVEASGRRIPLTRSGWEHEF
jgi:thiamine-monophosphate kinase